jgi:nicotinate-nucleotide adenylyltransferase
MQIALFGGSFDPPHRGHLQVGLTLLQQHLADEVWYVPVKKHPFGKNVTADEGRVGMLAAMITSPQTLQSGLAAHLKVSTHELDRNQPSYSYLTLTELAQLHPEHTFCWVIGSDNLGSFPRWHEYQQLLKHFTVYVYPREQFPMENLLPGMKQLAAAEVTVSSTQVRELVARGQSVRDLVEPTVENYIKDHQLYVAASS